jgi:glucosyl-3-phosphoglycerate phosphatase
MLLIRHGQSEFNVAFGRDRIDPGITDAPLTELGRRQALEAASAIAARRDEEPVEWLICSPYTRALQTAAIIGEVLDLPISVNPLIRELSAFACDIGTPLTHLLGRYPAHDFEQVIDEIWWHQHDRDGREPETALHERCHAFVETLARRDNWSTVAVVTHWGVIRALTGEGVENCEMKRCNPHDILRAGMQPVIAGVEAFDDPQTIAAD